MLPLRGLLSLPLRCRAIAIAAVFLLLSAEGSRVKPQRLIIVLVDGVRSDYVQRDSELQGFRRIARHGVTAEYVTPIFPSNSYPNWYTIVTGLYAENHGMVQNYMYDTEREDLFLMSPHPNASHEHWWNKSEPVWVTAERQGIRTAMHWWDGCQVPIRGFKPTLCHEYQNFWVWGNVKEDTREHMLGILDWFKASPDNRLALVYYEGVDATGHFQGPESPETIQSMRDIDEVLNDFQIKMEESEMSSEVNLVVVSDHGMAISDPHEVEVIQLEDYPNLTDDIQLMLDRGSVAMILPVPGREEKLYHHLKRLNIKGLRVYLRAEIPEKYRFRESNLVLPILLVAEEGFFIQKIREFKKMKPNYVRIFKGYHGYDPYKNTTKMRTIFYARGPAFREGVVSPPLHMVDHYNVFCDVLDLKCNPNNGSRTRTEYLLSSSSSNTPFVVVALMGLVTLAIF